MFSSVCGCLGCSCVLAVFKSLRPMLTLGIYPQGELLDYVAMLFPNVLRSGCVFSLHTAVPFYISMTIIQGFQFFCISLPSSFSSASPSFFFLPSFLLACRDSNMLMSMGWCLLILGVSLVIRDVEYLCMFLLDI